jgi:hypothetical protein
MVTAPQPLAGEPQAPPYHPEPLAEARRSFPRRVAEEVDHARDEVGLYGAEVRLPLPDTGSRDTYDSGSLALQQA